MILEKWCKVAPSQSRKRSMKKIIEAWTCIERSPQPGDSRQKLVVVHYADGTGNVLTEAGA